METVGAEINSDKMFFRLLIDSKPQGIELSGRLDEFI